MKFDDVVFCFVNVMFVCCCVYLFVFLLVALFERVEMYIQASKLASRVLDHHQLSTRPSHLTYTLTSSSNIITTIMNISVSLDCFRILLVFHSMGSMY